MFNSLLSCNNFFVQVCAAVTIALSSIFAFDIPVLISHELTRAESAWVLGMALLVPSSLFSLCWWLAICFFDLLSWLLIFWISEVKLAKAGIALFQGWIPGSVLPLHFLAPF
jgi:hypothetical protein